MHHLSQTSITESKTSDREAENEGGNGKSAAALPEAAVVFDHAGLRETAAQTEKDLQEFLEHLADYIIKGPLSNGPLRNKQLSAQNQKILRRLLSFQQEGSMRETVSISNVNNILEIIRFKLSCAMLDLDGFVEYFIRNIHPLYLPNNRQIDREDLRAIINEKLTKMRINSVDDIDITFSMIERICSDVREAVDDPGHSPTVPEAFATLNVIYTRTVEAQMARVLDGVLTDMQDSDIEEVLTTPSDKQWSVPK